MYHVWSSNVFPSPQYQPLCISTFCSLWTCNGHHLWSYLKWSEEYSNHFASPHVMNSQLIPLWSYSKCSETAPLCSSSMHWTPSKKSRCIEELIIKHKNLLSKSMYVKFIDSLSHSNACIHRFKRFNHIDIPPFLC
mgnify:FL=1